MRMGRRPAEELRRAVRCLPRATKEGMLRALDSEEIVVGAYATRDGGVCPMLGAHRRGGRTSLASFARAWDRYAGARRARRATERELGTLRAMLEEALAEDDMPTAEPGELAQALADHQRLMRGRFAREASRADDGALGLFRALETELDAGAGEVDAAPGEPIGA